MSEGVFWEDPEDIGAGDGGIKDQNQMAPVYEKDVLVIMGVIRTRI
jgi:hypothetical protein